MAVVIEGPHAGVAPDHVTGADAAAQIAIDRVAEVTDLFVTDRDLSRISGEGNIRGADQGEMPFIRDNENDPAVGDLKDEGALLRLPAGLYARHDNMTALDQAERCDAPAGDDLLQDL